MTEQVLLPWCEWDVGQEGVVFASVEAAEAWFRQAFEDQGFEETYEELDEQALFGWNWVEVIR